MASPFVYRTRIYLEILYHCLAVLQWNAIYRDFKKPSYPKIIPMTAPTRIRTFGDVEKLQQFNDFRFDQNSRELNKLIKTVAEISKSIDKLEMQVKETVKFGKKISKQLGDVHNSHGEFVESMVSGSIKKIVKCEFNANFHGKYMRNDAHFNIEIDAWGERERLGTREAFVFEVKRKFKRSHFRQLREQVAKFRQCNREYSSVYPFIAAAVISDADEQWLWSKGIHVLKFSNEIFQYCHPPENFQHAYWFGTRRNDAPQRMVPPPFFQEQLRRSSGFGKSVSIH